MIPLATGLLSLLGGTAAGRTDATPKQLGSVGELDFAGLLDQARAGEIHSGREITIASRAEVNLSEDQLKRLAAAADLAESQGATRALVLIDGQALRLDISMREVTEAVDLGKPGVLTSIDAVVTVPDLANSGKSHPSILPAPGDGRAWSNASLLSALAGRTDADRATEEAR